MKLALLLLVVAACEPPALPLPAKRPIVFTAREVDGMVVIEGTTEPSHMMRCAVPGQVHADNSGVFACKLPAPASGGSYRAGVSTTSWQHAGSEAEQTVERAPAPLELVSPPMDRHGFVCGGVVRSASRTFELAGRLGYVLDKAGNVTFRVQAPAAGTLEVNGAITKLAAARPAEVTIRAADWVGSITTDRASERSKCATDPLMRDLPPFDRKKCETVVIPFAMSSGSSTLQGHFACDAGLVMKVLERVTEGPLPFMTQRPAGEVKTAIVKSNTTQDLLSRRGPSVTLADVDVVVLPRLTVREHEPCEYRGTEDVITAERKSLDLSLVVYDPRTGEILAENMLRAKEPTCPSKLKRPLEKETFYEVVELAIAWPWLDTVVPR